MLEKCALPKEALLQTYAAKPDAHTDCYASHIEGVFTLEDYVGCFYRGRLFGLERWLLKIIVKRPSSEEQLKALLYNDGQSFAAWTLEKRTEDQLIMCDYQKRTRSWFMVEPTTGTGTRLYFGSAVVKTNYLKHGEGIAPLIFRLLMPFHYLYSRLLLSSAARRLPK